MKRCKFYLKNNLHFLITALIIFFFFTSYNNENGFHFNHKTVFLNSTMPQGWAFFTRNPREPQINLYKIENNNFLVLLNESPSLNIDLAFGLKRTDRRISIAMGAVATQHFNWKNYTGNLKSLLSDREFNRYSNKNTDDSKLTTGNYIMISEERIPWAWAKNFKTPKMKYYKFTVE